MDDAKRSQLIDAAVAALLAAVLVPLTIAYVQGDLASSRLSPVLATVIAFLMCAALAFRTTHPAASAAVVFLLALLHFSLGWYLLPVDVTVLIALFSVTAYGPLWAMRLAPAAAVLGCLMVASSSVLRFGALRFDGTEFAATLLALVGLVAVVWTAGTIRRNRLERLRDLQMRARQLETERDQQAQIATAAERTRIAREMHDIIAHSLSVMIAQADGGRYAARNDPASAIRALDVISEVGRASLADMRRLLGVLRDSDQEEPSPTQPQPIDADLDELVATVRDAGLHVSLVRMGTARPLPPGAGLAVHRIIQEALTNAMKHAGPHAKVTVMVQWLPSALSLQIDDDGRGAATPRDGRGHGIVGMRERAAIFGGTVGAGPRAGGGFQVKVLIPLPEQHPIVTPSQSTTSGEST